jgi:hypothetical protein
LTCNTRIGAGGIIFGSVMALGSNFRNRGGRFFRGLAAPELPMIYR